MIRKIVGGVILAAIALVFLFSLPYYVEERYEIGVGAAYEREAARVGLTLDQAVETQGHQQRLEDAKFGGVVYVIVIVVGWLLPLYGLVITLILYGFVFLSLRLSLYSAVALSLVGAVGTALGHFLVTNDIVGGIKGSIILWLVVMPIIMGIAFGAIWSVRRMVAPK